MKKFGLLVLTLAIFSCQPETNKNEQVIFNRIEYIFNLKPAIAGHFWKDFDKKEFDVPLLYYTDSSSYIANPPEEFIRFYKPGLVFQNQKITIYKTLKRYDDTPFHMETGFESGDTTKEIDLPIPIMNCSSFEVAARNVPNTTSTEYWVTMVIHEYFHGFQFKHKPYFEAVINYLSSVPEDSLKRICKHNSWFEEKIGRENNYLLKAIGAADQNKTISYVDSFLALRKERRSEVSGKLHFNIGDYEKIYETMEGTARYVEYKLQTEFATKNPDEKLMETDTSYKAYRIFKNYKMENDPWLYTADKKYYYATGFNMARLLDKMNVEYKTRLFKEGSLSLEQILADSVAER